MHNSLKDTLDKKHHLPLFVGGVGRSGTTILMEMLGTHKSIYSFDREMRFITDSDGLLDLKRKLSSSYSLQNARFAIMRFENLMLGAMSNKYHAPYIDYDFTEVFGGDFRNIVENLVKNLIHGFYQGGDLQFEDKGIFSFVRIRLRKLSHKLEFLIRRRFMFPKQRLYAAKYLSESEINEILYEFINDLYGALLLPENIEIVCEKTPSNIHFADEIMRTFPQSKFIHIKRDPRAIALSMSEHLWGSKDIELNSLMVRDSINRIYQTSSNFGSISKRRLDICLEDLASEPEAYSTKLEAFLGVSGKFSGANELDPKRVDRWKKRISRSDLEATTRILRPVMKKYGYE